MWVKILEVGQGALDSILLWRGKGEEGRREKRRGAPSTTGGPP